jgi:hypothetical protein
MRMETSQFLHLRSVQSWPSNLNCGQFVRLLRQFPGFRWDMVAADRPAFDAFKRSILRSLRVLDRHMKKLMILDDFSLRPPEEIDISANPQQVDMAINYNFYRIQRAPRERIRGLAEIHFHKEVGLSGRWRFDRNRSPAIVQPLRVQRVRGLVESCEKIAVWKRQIQRIADVYPSFIDLLRDYKRSRNVHDFRVRAKALGIAPFHYLRASDQTIAQRLDTYVLYSIPTLRRLAAKDIRFVRTTILPPLRV